MPVPLIEQEQLRRIALIAQSFAALTGQPLVEGAGAQPEEIVERLWRAPQVIVAHDTAPDPVFFFANRAALTLFEMDFEAFTQLPSRLSAEPMLREERAHLLERVARDGIITDYAGVRVSATGRRFRIEQAAVWNLIDADAVRHGQAAAFARWTPL